MRILTTTVLLPMLFVSSTTLAQETGSAQASNSKDKSVGGPVSATNLLEQEVPRYLELIAPLTNLNPPPKSTGTPFRLVVKSDEDAVVGKGDPVTKVARLNTSDASSSDAAEAMTADDKKTTEDALDEAAAKVEAARPTEIKSNIDYLGTPMEVSELGELRNHVRRTLIHYYERPESANTRSPWGVMHSLIGFGVDTEIGAGREKVNAIGWLCWNGSCRGQRLFKLTKDGMSVNVGPGVQGHTGQFLSMLAQSRVPEDFEIRIQGKSFTVADLIAYEQATCRPRTELTFKLIGLSHYLPSDAEWTSNDGQEWSISRLIEEELAQPVIGAACGGTHRLMGLTYAVKNRVDDGKPVDGQFHRAELFLEDFQKYTVGLQNPDGSFSTKWFERREARTDSQRRVQTTGHILEWLICNLPEDQLTSPEVVKAVAYLSNLMYRERGTDWNIGPKGHAIHALNLYDQKVFGAEMGQGGPRMSWKEAETIQR